MSSGKYEGKLYRLGRQALAIMVLDLEYSNQLRPLYGHTPLRHQFLWGFIKEALGDRFDEEVEKLVGTQSENQPVKTNPWL